MFGEVVGGCLEELWVGVCELCVWVIERVHEKCVSV